jgi:eukaryotic-like serine/threonine-protein kinase
VEDVTAAGPGEGTPGSKDDGRQAQRIAIGIAVAVVVALVLWLLWPRFGSVPNVIGLNQDRALTAIEKAGFRVGVVETRSVDTTDAGTVVGQLPPPGMRIGAGSEIDFTIAVPSPTAESTGFPPGAATSEVPSGAVVPVVTDRTETDARSRLQVAGLSATTEFQSSAMPQGEVIHQFPEAGVIVPPNTPVLLTISSGAALTGSAAVGSSGRVIPEVVGLTLGTARSRLSAAGLGTRVVYAPSTTTPRGLIFWQSHGPGPDTRDPSTVEVWISTGTPRNGAPYPVPSDEAPFMKDLPR